VLRAPPRRSCGPNNAIAPREQSEGSVNYLINKTILIKAEKVNILKYQKMKNR
jgi:hypothetical protein